ncbi:MAG: hypothetical protein C6W58_03065 [Bacillaceae bacterium]|nr:MAG: hypothetical protein C6W58_03065 [Bacillaceae bacterium]
MFLSTCFLLGTYRAVPYFLLHPVIVCFVIGTHHSPGNHVISLLFPIGNILFPKIGFWYKKDFFVYPTKHKQP